ncbi:MAG: ferritin-like domain-containing protein [Proteobacteria bacterium]|nr:ferritin-like domain-containing protein [Pseudomonadota bacterium]
MAGKNKKGLKDMLNDAIAREIQVSVQYMWQHVQAVGLKGEVVKGIFKKFAITEMKHAEAIAERLVMLGGVPTTVPTPITIGKNVDEMLKIDKKAEEEAIAMYKEIIALANKEGDYITANLFIGILADEEEHFASFESYLSK